MDKIHQVFVSYRRDGGEAMAELLFEKLTQRGYSVCYDIDSFRNGDFIERIRREIEAANDYVIVLSPNSLERCNDPGDIVLQEIRFAMQYGINIVPVIMRGFSYPKVLPVDISDFVHIGGVIFDSMEYIDQKIDKLISFLQTKRPNEEQPNIDEQMNIHFEELVVANNDKAKESELSRKIRNKEIQNVLNILTDTPDRLLLQHLHNVDTGIVVPINDDKFSLQVDDKTKVVAYFCEKRDYNNNELYKPYVDIRELQMCANDNGIVSFTLDDCLYKDYTISDFGHYFSMNRCIFSVTEDYRFGVGLMILITIIKHDKAFIFKASILRGKNNDKEDYKLYFDNKQSSVIHWKLNRNNLCFSETNEISYTADVNSDIMVLDTRTGRLIKRQTYKTESGDFKTAFKLETNVRYIAMKFSITDRSAPRPMTAYEIGMCMLEGTCGFPFDPSGAVEHFEAEGTPDALYEISKLFQQPEYQDEEVSAHYLLKAARAGNESAIIELCEYYHREHKCIEDLLVAYDIMNALLTKMNIDLNETNKSSACKWDMPMADICKDIGDYYYKQAEYEKALPYLERACKLYKRKADAYTFSRYPVFALASFVRLGRVQYWMHKDSEAFESLKEAERQFKKEHAKPWDISDVEYKEILVSYWAFAYDLMLDRGSYRLELAQHKVELDRELLGLNECDKYKWWLAVDLVDKGMCYYYKSEYGSTITAMTEAISILTPMMEPSNKKWKWAFDTANKCLSEAYKYAGDTTFPD